MQERLAAKDLQIAQLADQVDSLKHHLAIAAIKLCQLDDYRLGDIEQLAAQDEMTR